MWKKLLNEIRRAAGREREKELSEAPPVVAVPAATPAAPADEPPRAEREPEWVGAYRQWIADSYGTVRILDMTESLPLDRLYIPLSLFSPSETAPQPEMLERRFVNIDDQIGQNTDWRRSSGASFPGPCEALLEYGRVAVVGDPGAGKTTMLRHLAVRLATGQEDSLPRLPLVVDLHEVGHCSLLKTVPPEELLLAWLERRIEDVVAPSSGVGTWLRRTLEAGSAVVLLDGLDEVAGATAGEAGPYRVVSKALASLAASFPQAKMLVTCRRAHIERFVQIPAGFQILETSEFEWEHMSRFLDLWFRESPDTAEVLKSHLKRNIRIRGLAGNPLLLALVCIIFQRRGSLPQRRSDIYKRCVDVLLAEWDASRKKDRFPRFTLEHKEDLLRRVAWRFHEMGRRYIRREELVRLIASFLPMIRLREDDAEAILDEITTHHGLLKDFGHGWYGFHHFTLQEHFATESITSWQRLDAALALRNRNWWREIIRLYAGKGDCTELVCRLASEREDLFQSNLCLIAECLEEGSAVLPELLANTRSELTRIARRQSKPVAGRVRASDLAARLLPDDDVGSAVEWLTDDHVPVAGRLAVAKHISYKLGPEHMEELESLVAAPTLDVRIRETLANALSAVSDGDGLRRLTERISHEADTLTHQRLALVIGQGHSDHYEAILPLIEDDGVAIESRLGLAVAFGQSARPGVGRAVRSLIERIGEPTVRSALEVSLFRLGENGLLERVRATLHEQSVDAWVRTQAAQALAVRNRVAARPMLWKIVTDGSQERTVRVVAAHHLVNVADDALRLSLVDAVRDEMLDRFVRAAIVESMGESRSHLLTAPLLSLCGDSGVLQYVRCTIVDALGVLGDAEAAPDLLDLWRAEQAEPRLRARALVALGRLGTERTFREISDELVNIRLDRNLRRSLAEVMLPSGTSADAEVLERACRWVRDTDIPGAILTLIARFSAEAGKTVYPEDLGMRSIEYPWAKDRPSRISGQ